jgi:hypothetical protein
VRYRTVLNFDGLARTHQRVEAFIGLRLSSNSSLVMRLAERRCCLLPFDGEFVGPSAHARLHDRRQL